MYLYVCARRRDYWTKKKKKTLCLSKTAFNHMENKKGRIVQKRFNNNKKIVAVNGYRVTESVQRSVQLRVYRVIYVGDG